MLSGIGSSIDCDKIRTISRHFGVCLPMKITSLVCSQLRRATTDGLPIGDGLYRSSGITLSLPSPIKPAMDVIRPPGFHLHNHMSRQPFGTLQKEGAQNRHGRENATLLAQRS